MSSNDDIPSRPRSQGSARSPRGQVAPARKTKGPAAERRRSAAEPDEPEERAAKPFYKGPLFWTASVAVFIGAVLGVSFVVGSDYRDPEVGDDDVAAFCNEAQSYSRAVARSSTSGNTAAQFREYAERLGAMASVAPSSMRATMELLATQTSALSGEIDEIEKGGAEANTALIQGVLTRFEKRNRPDIDRFTAYLKKACGIDLSVVEADLDPTSTSEVPGGGPLPGPPSDVPAPGGSLPSGPTVPGSSSTTVPGEAPT